MVLLPLIVAPVVFVITLWVAVSFYRIMKDEHAVGPYDPAFLDVTIGDDDEPEPVGASTIRERERRHHRINSLASPYDFLDGHSDGIPEAWWRDIIARRN